MDAIEGNGRIDLTQAEAVLEVLTAKTNEGLNLALEQLKGGLHQEVQSVCDVLVSIKAIIEVASERGRRLDYWETAAKLLQDLGKEGWDQAP